MALRLIEAQNRNDLQRFLEFPYKLYKGNPYWVPPLRMEQQDWILNKNTPLLRGHPNLFLLVEQEGRIVGRTAVVNDLTLNTAKDKKYASMAFLEFEDNAEVVDLLVERMISWAREQGLNELIGPISPTKGDDVRGMLYWGGFDARPVLMNVYNPEYYVGHMERLGFGEHVDLVAYHYDMATLDHERKLEVLEYAKRKFGFTIDPLDKSKLEREARDIRIVIEKSAPDWFDLVPPSEEYIMEMALRLKRFADPGLVLIARDLELNPIGFNLTMPDYNEVFRHLNGNLGLVGLLKFFYYRRRIKGARSFVMFTVPEWRKKGVSHGLYLTAFQRAIKLGHSYGEGSTIGKWNDTMRRDAEKVGGVHYRTYRIWGKDI